MITDKPAAPNANNDFDAPCLPRVVSGRVWRNRRCGGPMSPIEGCPGWNPSVNYLVTLAPIMAIQRLRILDVAAQSDLNQYQEIVRRMEHRDVRADLLRHIGSMMKSS
jgi:hypothetical protein